MLVLVDYDNLPRLERQRGIQNVVYKLLNTLGVSPLSAYKRIKVRLYGGWYERNTLSRRAQQLATEVQLYFPGNVTVSDGSRTISLMTAVELAYSMEIDPRHNLEDTYRNRNMPQGLQCASPPYTRCSNTVGCPISALYTFLNTDLCPEPGCQVTPNNVIRRSEQKLVDTMLTADLIYTASSGGMDVCITSSDDDLWPGIKTALILGRHVYHIHTRAGRPTPAHYSRNAGPNYTQLVLR